MEPVIIGDKLYEGKAKAVYATGDPDVRVIKYKDSATAGNGARKAEIAGKGELNRRICSKIFTMLNNAGIPTHFIRDLGEDGQLVKKCAIIPLEVIVRNVAAGSFSARFGVPEGAALSRPTLEYCYKDDALGDPMINDYHIKALGLASDGELAETARLSFEINELLSAYFRKAGLRLVDFKLEFGRTPDGIALADEISPDTCRLWDMETNAKLDKDVFRRGLGDLAGAYAEVLRRISG
ncbi:MAG: phosphoribosylaminoimidazolesuccinocarboxamide synthase [Clostridiales bacterium]|jgi:phosphoribosylaminoimidazole-succinocarboxamide synthase|nr:phosphoribosylaminoimidazolesuccinocarboxamide synthase [Clostridiales bacterium]